jgi:signal transduction histidine kinase
MVSVQMSTQVKKSFQTIISRFFARPLAKARLPLNEARDDQQALAILEAIAGLADGPSLAGSLAGLAEKAAHLAGVERCAIVRWQRETNTLEIAAEYIAPTLAGGDQPRPEKGLYPLAGYPALAAVLQQNAPRLIRLSEWLKAEAGQESGWAGLWLLPLRCQGQALGLLGLYIKEEDGRSFRPAGPTLWPLLAAQLGLLLKQAELLAELSQKEAAARQLSRQLVSAQEAERRRVARELHDELGQALTALKINLDLAQRALAAAAPPELAKLQHNLREARALAGQTLELARDLALDLRPAMLDDLGLAAALRWTVDRYERRTGQKLHCQINLAGLNLSPELEIALYRLINEALTNVARHAAAGQVWVYLGVEKGRLLARVKDNGRGFDLAAWQQSPAASTSLGLISMRERAALLGGELTIASKPGRGTTVEARFPLPD